MTPAICRSQEPVRSGSDALSATLGTAGVVVLGTLLGSPLASQSPSQLERSVLEQTNRARANPSAYADYLELLLERFEGKLMYWPGSSIGIRTAEGPAAVREAIIFLRAQTPAPALEWSRGLWRAARDHARDLGASGAMGHEGSDGSTMDERMSRYGEWLGTAAENIDFGNDDPRHVVLSLIIDDGVPNRGHRATIFNASLRVAGVGCGPHPRYRHVCVIDYAGGYEEAGRRER